MAKFFNTQTKRMLAMISLVIVGWHSITMGFNNLPRWPPLIENPVIGQVSILVIAGAYALWSGWMLLNDEL